MGFKINRKELKDIMCDDVPFNGKCEFANLLLEIGDGQYLSNDNCLVDLTSPPNDTLEHVSEIYYGQ